MGIEKYYVIFRIEQQSFGIRLSDVYRIVRVVHVTSVPEAPQVVEGVINVQGDIIPVINLRKRFKLDIRDLNLDDQIILIKSSTRLLGLLVDEVVDILESSAEDIVSQKNILPGADRIQGVMKNNESMILIQDIETLLSADEEQKLEKSLKKSTKSKK